MQTSSSQKVHLKMSNQAPAAFSQAAGPRKPCETHAAEALTRKSGGPLVTHSIRSLHASGGPLAAARLRAAIAEREVGLRAGGGEQRPLRLAPGLRGRAGRRHRPLDGVDERAACGCIVPV